MEGTNSTRSSDAVDAPAAEAGAGGVGPGAAHPRGGVSARLVAMLILVCPALAVLGAVSWGILLGKQSAAEQQKRQAQTVARALAEPIRAILEAGTPALLPSLLYQTAQDNKLERCSVELSDGQVLATSDRTPPRKLPDSWKAAELMPVAGVLGPDSGGFVTARVEVEVRDRGTAYVVVTCPPTAALGVRPGLGGAWLGLWLVGAVSLATLAVMYKRVRQGLRPLGAIQDALRSLAAGERSTAALKISPRWGAEAAAWNDLLAERESLRRMALERQGGLGAPGAASARAGDSTAERACDAMSQGLLVVDSALRVRYANGAAAVLLGRKRTEMTGKVLGEVVTDAPALELVRSVLASKGAIAGKRRGSAEVEREADGERSVLRFSVTRMPQEPGQPVTGSGPVLVVLEDLTQQRVADQARDTFVTHATHELRTPLTNVRLYVEMLQEEGASDAAVRGKCINVINTESRRLERMVTDMLSVAEIEAGSMKLHIDDVRLEPLLDELRDDYLAQAQEKEIRLGFELPPKLPVLRGDRDKLAMCLHNLVGNALKYTPAGGTVTVKVDAGESGVIVRVKDTGIGISADEAGRIFEKFYRSKDKRVAQITGSGLGLALAREVARLHGGDITVESQLDRGSTFTLTLPMAPALARAA